MKTIFSEPRAKELRYALEEEINRAIASGAGLGEIAAALGFLLQRALERIPKKHRAPIVATACTQLQRANAKP